MTVFSGTPCSVGVVAETIFAFAFFQTTGIAAKRRVVLLKVTLAQNSLEVVP